MYLSELQMWFTIAKLFAIKMVGTNINENTSNNFWATLFLGRKVKTVPKAKWYRAKRYRAKGRQEITETEDNRVVLRRKFQMKIIAFLLRINCSRITFQMHVGHYIVLERHLKCELVH